MKMQLLNKLSIFWISFTLHSLLRVIASLSDDIAFDCNNRTSCETCFNSMSKCEWCPRAKKCTHDAANNCWEDKQPEIKVHRDINIHSGRHIDFSIGNVQLDICKKMPNLQCLFTIDEKYNVTNASMKNGSLIYCGNILFEYVQNISNITASFSIFWRTTTFYGALYKSSLVIYKCQYMAHSKATCEMLDKKYDCGWSQSSNTCKYQKSLGNKSMDVFDKYTDLQTLTAADPKIISIYPHEGPIYGGTVLTIEGENFNAVKHIRVLIGNTSSQVFSHSSKEIKCITNSSPEKEAKVTVKFDGKSTNFSNNSFTYIKDQDRDENGFNIEPTGILAGGVTILIHNISLTPTQELMFYIFNGNQNYSSPCRAQNDSTVKCLSPHIPDIDNGLLDVKNPKKMKYSLKNSTTGENISIFENKRSTFLLFPNPKFNYFYNSSVQFDGEHFLIIQGHHINKACHKTDITVNVGNHTCEVKSMSLVQLICRLPKFSSSPTTDSENEHDILAEHKYVDVSIGEYFKVSVPKQGSEASEKDRLYVIIFGATIFCLVVISLLTCYHFFRRRKIIVKSSQKINQIQQKMNAMGMETIAVKQCIKKVIVENQIDLDGESLNILKLPNVTIEYASMSVPKNSTKSSSQTHYIFPVDDKWEFPRSKLVLGKILGEGEFGKVVQGEALGISPEYPTMTVAVKMLKNTRSDSDMIDLVSEMEIMKSIGTHNNVLQLLGCCTRDGDLLIITEFAHHGNLRDFLRRHIPFGNNTQPLSNLSVKNLLNFAFQVAEGMEYLASRKCVHRDLAARNILVSEDYTMKIGDFGLARDIKNKDYYKKESDGRLPLKWMAPEALCHSIFSTQSDVWSYGILLWEIFTLGGAPYPSFIEMGRLYQALHSGFRMEKPPNCSDKLYHLMRKCWSFIPDGRPMFSEIVNNLEEILSNDEVSNQGCHVECKM